MADEKTLKDLLGVNDLEEFETRAKAVFNKIKTEGEKDLGELKDALAQIFAILKNDVPTMDFFSTADTLEDIKQKTTEIVKQLLRKKELTQEELQYLNNVAELSATSVEKTGQNLILEEDINKQLRIKIGLMDELETGSLLITKYTLQNLRGYSDMLDPLTTIKRIQQDLSEMTAEQARIYIQGTMVKKMGEISNVFMQTVGSLATIKAEFNKLTTDTETFLDNVRVAAKETSGLSFEEAAATTKELINGMSQFTRLTEDTRTELVKTVAMMDKLGLSTQNQVMLLQMTTKSFGMSVSQAQSSLTRIQSFAESTGIPMSELNKNLGAAGTKLAAFGQGGYEKVFQSLSIAAKNLGIEMGKLLSITEGFTTFDGAAQAAGQLNAVLGGNFINSISLLEGAMENPIEAFARIKEGMDASGKSFRDMSLPMQRHIASLLNMEVSEAQALFSQSLGSATAQMTMQAKKQEELNALAAKSTDAFKRLEIAFQKIVASPVTQWIISFVELLASAVEGLLQFPIIGDAMSGIITAIAALAILMVSVNSIVKTSTMAWQMLTLVIGENRLAKLSNWLMDQRWIASFAAWVTAKLTKIGLIKAEGEAEVLAATEKAAAREIEAGGIAAMGATLSSLGPLTPVLYAVAGVILAIGAAVALTGLGVWLMADGFAKLVPVMVAAGVEGYGAIGMMLLMTWAIFQLISSIAIAAAAATVAWPIILALGGAFALVGAGLGIYMALQAKVKEQEKEALQTEKELIQAKKDYAEQVNQTFGSLLEFSRILATLETFDPFTLFAEGIARISEEIDKLDLEKLTLLNGSFNARVTSTTASVPSTPAGVMSQNVPSVRVTEIAGQREAQMASQANNQNANEPIAINVVIDAPLQINGDQIARIAYNATQYAKREERSGTNLGQFGVTFSDIMTTT